MARSCFVCNLTAGSLLFLSLKGSLLLFPLFHITPLLQIATNFYIGCSVFLVGISLQQESLITNSQHGQCVPALSPNCGKVLLWDLLRQKGKGRKTAPGPQPQSAPGGALAGSYGELSTWQNWALGRRESACCPRCLCRALGLCRTRGWESQHLRGYVTRTLTRWVAENTAQFLLRSQKHVAEWLPLLRLMAELRENEIQLSFRTDSFPLRICV